MWVEDLKDRYDKNHGADIYTTLEKTVKASIDHSRISGLSNV